VRKGTPILKLECAHMVASAHVKQNSEASPMGEDHGLWFSEYHAIVIEHLNLAHHGNKITCEC